ncbi:translation initiation factor IF-2 [Ixodes scapularis]
MALRAPRRQLAGKRNTVALRSAVLLISTPTNMAAPQTSTSSAAATSALAKPARPRKYTSDELRERSNEAQRARRQAVKSIIVAKSPNKRRAERAAAQRARRQNKAFRKREAQADRDSNRLRRQEDEAEAIRRRHHDFAFTTHEKCLGVLRRFFFPKSEPSI